MRKNIADFSQKISKLSRDLPPAYKWIFTHALFKIHLRIYALIKNSPIALDNQINHSTISRISQIYRLKHSQSHSIQFWSHKSFKTLNPPITISEHPHYVMLPWTPRISVSRMIVCTMRVQLYEYAGEISIRHGCIYSHACMNICSIELSEFHISKKFFFNA